MTTPPGPRPQAKPQPQEVPHIAHLSNNGLLLLTQVLFTAVLKLPVEVLMYFQNLKKQVSGGCRQQRATKEPRGVGQGLGVDLLQEPQKDITTACTPPCGTWQPLLAATKTESPRG